MTKNTLAQIIASGLNSQHGEVFPAYLDLETLAHATIDGVVDLEELAQFILDRLR